MSAKNYLTASDVSEYMGEIENRCGDKIDILWVEEWLKETMYRSIWGSRFPWLTKLSED